MAPKNRLTMGVKTFLLGTTLALLSGPAHAIPLIDNLGGPEGFGENFLPPNDDGSTSQLNLPFNINFFGNTFSNYFVNNNGNITFQNPLSTFTPSFFPGAPQPIIAPWWADVDTRGSGSGVVWYDSTVPDTVVVTWNNVGYFPSEDNLLNNFQLVLRNDSAITGNPGDFSFDFRYEQLEWTTGSASGGSGGFGGTPALAGYDSGNGVDFAQLPGSLSGAVLDLVNTSNVSANTPGLWSFNVRNGSVVVPPQPDGGTSVPGPLPIFGVGAALGWSRRMRRRIASVG